MTGGGGKERMSFLFWFGFLFAKLLKEKPVPQGSKQN